MGRFEDILKFIGDEEKINGKTLKLAVLAAYKTICNEIIPSNEKLVRIEEEMFALEKIEKRQNEGISSLKTLINQQQDEMNVLSTKIQKMVEVVKTLSQQKLPITDKPSQSKSPVSNINSQPKSPVSEKIDKKDVHKKTKQTSMTTTAHDLCFLPRLLSPTPSTQQETLKSSPRTPKSIVQPKKEKEVLEIKEVDDENFIGSLEQKNVIGKSAEILREWIGLKKCQVIYDSVAERMKNRQETGKSFGEQIIGKKNVCFINFDENDNVFGVFTPQGIREFDCDEGDEMLFSFLLKTRRLVTVPKRWAINPLKKCGVMIKRDSSILYSFGQFSGNGFVEISKTWVKQSWSHNISSSFYGMNETALVGSNDDPFVVQRIFVLEFS